MVLDITRLSILNFFSHLWLDSLELSHDDFHRLSHDVGERVKTASMSHTNDKGASALLDG